MLRLLQTSDVHIGARHPSIGQHGGVLRERQIAAFERSIDLALAMAVDVVVVAGDLFDGSVAPRSSVERVATSVRRLVEAGSHVVVVPGSRDAPGRASLYYVHAFTELAGGSARAAAVMLLTAERPDVQIADIGARFTTRFPAPDLPEDGWRIGVLHREPRPRDDEIAGAGVDYLAIGGPHGPDAGHTGTVTWAASGAPELVDIEDDQAGDVLVVTLQDDAPRPTIDRHRVGRTRFASVEVDAGTLRDQASLIEQLAAMADPDLILEAEVVGMWPDELDFDTEAAEAVLEDRFLAVHVRSSAIATLPIEPLPPPDTIHGAFIRDLESRIADLEARGERLPALELREALRLGRRLLVPRGSGE